MSRRTTKTWTGGLGVALVLALTAFFQQTSGVTAAGPSTLVTAVTVPWQGITTQAHPIGDAAGTTTTFVQGVAYAFGTSDYAPCSSISSISWDFGDGSPVATFGCSNTANLGISHTYPVAIAGTPYTAVLTITDTAGNTSSANFRIVVQPKSIDLEANMAIDKGLWFLHTQLSRGVSAGVKIGNWSSNTPVAATATSLNAFEVNNHLPSGNALTDPYVDDVQRGLAWITSQLAVQNVTALQGGENPDTNGNGIGLYPTGYSSINYITGQVVSALVASGTPNAIAPLGVVGTPIENGVKGRTYKDITQDLLDYNNWGQNDPGSAADTGSWYYTPANGFPSRADTSVAQWPAIAAITARDGAGFGLATPQWVLDRTQAWLTNCQFNGGTADGRWDYDCRGSNWHAYTAETPAALIMAEMVGWQNDPSAATANELRFQRAVNFLARDWTCTGGVGCRTYLANNSFYGYFAATKAFRLAKPNQVTALTYPAGHPLAGQTFDWYGNDPSAAQQSAGHAVGMARIVLGKQLANGSFSDGYWMGNSHLATAMGVIILSPAIFELGPTAVCSSDATITCDADAGCGGSVGEYAPVTFDGSQSYHNDPNGTISSYSWNFQDGSPVASTVSTTHSFDPATTPATFNVQLTVTDSKGHTSSATCPVKVVSTALPPVADPGGPYIACQGSPLTLDGSASLGRGSNIMSYEWDWTAPVNFASVDASTATTTWTAAYISSLALGTYDVGLRVADDSSPQFVTTAFTTVNVLAATDPRCNQPPDALDDSAATDSGVAVTIPVLGNDTDPNAGQTLTVSNNTAAGNGSVMLNADGTFTYSPNLGFAGTDTFTYTISDGHGGTDTATVTIVVSKIAASVTAGSGTKVYGSADPVMTPTSTGFGGDITVSQNGREAGEDVGSYATHATASGATLANYDVTYTDGLLTITKATPVATATGGTFTYDGAAHAGTCTVGGVNGEVLTGTISYSSGGAPVAQGTYTVTCAFAGDGNYEPASGDATITITKAAATVTAGSGTKVYGTADPAIGATTSGFVPADGITASATRAGGEDVGDYVTTATASGAALDNYDVTYVAGTFSITKATPVATATGGTFTYDGTAHEGTCTVDGVNGEVLTGTISYSSGGAPVAQGTYTVTCAFAGNGNYEPASGDATITITKAAATVTAGSGTKVYGSADPAIGATATGFVAADGITVSATRAAGENVGDYVTTAAASGAALANYDVTYVAGNFSITPAALIVTANDASRHFGVPNPAFTVSYAGFQFGDTPASLGGTLSITTTATLLSPIGTYPIVPSGLMSPNYTITFVNGTLTINNNAPVCSAAAPSVSLLWPPNHQMVPITLTGVTDADGDALTITVTSIFQDEGVGSGGSGNTGPDGAGVGTSTAQVRAERVGNPKTPGNGRVYYITYDVTDPAGGSCSTTVQVGVPHDQSGKTQPIGDGPLYNSTIAVPKK